ncbi:hypothetical protein, partial [Cupriavidus necator]
LACFGLPAFVLEAARLVTQKQVRKSLALPALVLQAGGSDDWSHGGGRWATRQGCPRFASHPLPVNDTDTG